MSSSAADSHFPISPPRQQTSTTRSKTTVCRVAVEWLVDYDDVLRCDGYGHTLPGRGTRERGLKFPRASKFSWLPTCSVLCTTATGPRGRGPRPVGGQGRWAEAAGTLYPAEVEVAAHNSRAGQSSAQKEGGREREREGEGEEGCLRRRQRKEGRKEGRKKGRKGAKLGLRLSLGLYPKAEPTGRLSWAGEVSSRIVCERGVGGVGGAAWIAVQHPQLRLD
ncbi:hypothetical protein AXG93_786s1210 [Marchantia polymorpha subsp. ruderalis]|uniref:Uncharacterized protein n=1 Tax=Marchantia polymorpha subsp. ruderalis TaxID=1480154 RepID=A0A176WKH2_MARPO|nr:hypothetical protein AXG93_786s1210 [Marchantia polymorpha subsp. ruderalis]